MLPQSSSPQRAAARALANMSDAELFSLVKLDQDSNALDILVERHRGLAVHLAARYSRMGEPLDDVIQVACIGLCKAVERFDPDRGVAFSSFAVPTILGDIRRHFRDASRTVRVPRRLGDLARQSRNVTETLAIELGRNPSLEEIARELGVDEHELAEALDAVSNSHPGTLEGVEPSPDATSDYDMVDNKHAVSNMLAVLPDREKEIVMLRFFHDMSQTEIAEKLDISQMHVSRLLKQSLKTMRAHGASFGDEDITISST